MSANKLQIKCSFILFECISFKFVHTDISSMYLQSFLIYLFLHCGPVFTQDEYDVTTVYSIGENTHDDLVYVHFSDKTLISAFTSLVVGDRIVDLIEGNRENLEDLASVYTFDEDGCSECSIDQPVNPDGDSLLSEYFTFNQYTFLRFELVNCEIIKLILTENEKPVSVQRQFFYIASDDCHSFKIYKCNNTFGTDKVYINDKKFMCWEVESFSVDYSYKTNKLYWYIKQTLKNIIIWSFTYNRDDKKWTYNGKRTISLQDDSFTNVNFFAVHASNHESKNILKAVRSWGMYYKFEKDTSLKGQWFTPVYKNMCLTLSFYTEEIFNDVLRIHCEKRSYSDTIFMGMAGKHSKAGWQIENVVLTWPEGIQNSEVRLIIETLYDEVRIEKIYMSQIDDVNGCNSIDESAIPLLRTDYKSAISENVITLARTDYEGGISAMAVLTDRDLKKRKPVHFIPNRIFSDKFKILCGFYGSSCPPGFTGTDCDQGCGKNRFGTNCSSLCSTHSTGCRGLLLCTPSVGCVCPPGYRGETCEEECETGFYGNNCSQMCGKCKENTCNIYTGACTSCLPGYYLPLCKYKYAVMSSPPGVKVTTFGEVTVIPDFSKITSRTPPELYSVEYRKVFPSNLWIRYTTLAIPENDNPQKTIIRGLEHGVRYEVRIVLIDRDLNSYEEDGFVPTAEFVTLCIVPDTDLNLQTDNNETSVTVAWQFENYEMNNSKYWCPVKHFEVYWKEGWKWVTMNTTDNKISVHNQLPGMKFEFKVRALTVNGFTSYSPITFVSTLFSSNVTDPVRNLVVTERHSESAYVSWNPPLSLLGNMELTYILKYKCMLRAACLKNCSESGGEVNTTNTSARINGLLSYSQYLVTVSANGGPRSDVTFGTTMSVPMEAPEPHTEMPLRTNTSVTVYWKQPEVCSGVFNNYFYQVYKESDLLKSGSTSDTNATIDSLVPHSEYKVRVFVQSISGSLNLDKYLEINVSTTASVPEKVGNLTVYKQGRSLLGIRWAPPERIHGTLKSFMVTTELNSVIIKSAVIEPTPCIAWPHLFCYTVTSLNANKIYTVSVTARNSESDADGAAATVTGVTKEKPPLAPENFKLVDITSTTGGVQWDYPFVANGILRSFVLNIEETEQFEAEKCCEIFPLIEIPITEELEHYTTQVTGLNPASIYAVSVSAKTIGLGPSQKLVVRTRPPQLSATQPNVTTNVLHEEWHWLNNSDSTELYSYQVYKPLIKVPMLLLAVTNDTVFNETGIQDITLENLLKSVIRGSFYLTAEYTDEAPHIKIGDNKIIYGKWGKIRNVPLKPQTDYQLAAIQVTEYNGIYNVAVSLTTTLTTA